MLLRSLRERFELGCRTNQRLFSFLAEEPMRLAIHEVQLTTSGAIHDGEGISSRLQVVIYPLLDVVPDRRTSEGDCGHYTRRDTNQETGYFTGV